MEIKTIEKIVRAKVNLGCNDKINHILYFELNNDCNKLEIQYREEGEDLGCIRSIHTITKGSVDKLVDLLLKFYDQMDEL